MSDAEDAEVLRKVRKTLDEFIAKGQFQPVSYTDLIKKIQELVK